MQHDLICKPSINISSNNSNNSSENIINNFNNLNNNINENNNISSNNTDFNNDNNNIDNNAQNEDITGEKLLLEIFPNYDFNKMIQKLIDFDFDIDSVILNIVEENEKVESKKPKLKSDDLDNRDNFITIIKKKTF